MKLRVVAINLLSVATLAVAAGCDDASKHDQKITDTASGYYLEKVRADPYAGDLTFGAVAVDACAFAVKHLGPADDAARVSIDFALNALTVHTSEHISSSLGDDDFQALCRTGLKHAK